MLRMVTVDPDGTPTLWLGLSDENRQRLPQEPIKVDLPDVELAGGKLVIMAGNTERSMAEQLKALGLPIPESALFGWNDHPAAPGRRS